MMACDVLARARYHEPLHTSKTPTLVLLNERTVVVPLLLQTAKIGYTSRGLIGDQIGGLDGGSLSSFSAVESEKFCWAGSTPVEKM